MPTASAAIHQIGAGSDLIMNMTRREFMVAGLAGAAGLCVGGYATGGRAAEPHLIGGNHYAPMPWNNRAPSPDWTATYYRRAAEDGIGVDHTKQGDHAVEQYPQGMMDGPHAE